MKQKISDILDQQKRGIATATLNIPAQTLLPEDSFLCNKSSVLSRQFIRYRNNGVYLTLAGWRKSRSRVKQAYEKNAANGIMPCCLTPFDYFEKQILEEVKELDAFCINHDNYASRLGIDLPVLVITASIMDKTTYEPVSPPLKRGRKWTRLKHQGSGVSCSQHEWDAIVVPLNEFGHKLAKSLHVRYDDSGIRQNALFSDLQEYTAELKGFGITCEQNYTEFCESVYPIDTSHICKLTNTKLPVNLDTLVDWNKVWAMDESMSDKSLASLRSVLSHAHWKAFILCENSD